MASDVDIWAFLAARLDEDEAAAKTAGGFLDSGGQEELARDLGAFRFRDTPLAAAARAHIARHGPDRVLRDVAAGRALLMRHEEDRHRAGQCSNCFDALGRHDAWPCDTIRIVASVYSDHPDYRQE